MALGAFNIENVLAGISAGVTLIPTLVMLVVGFVLPKGFVQITTVIGGVLTLMALAFGGGFWNVVGTIAICFLLIGIAYVVGMSIYLKQPSVIVETRNNGIMDVFLYDRPGKRFGVYAIKLLYTAFLPSAIFMGLSPEAKITGLVVASGFLCCMIAGLVLMLNILLGLFFDRRY